MSWLPQIERIESPRDGGSFVATVEKLLWHSTEGYSIAGAVGAYRASGAYPHLTADFRTRRLVQHLPLNVAARALRNRPGGAQTNRQGVIQVELVGRAEEMGWLTDGELEWIGSAVARPILGVHPTIPNVIGAPFSTVNHSRVGHLRLNAAQWVAAKGHVAHLHAVENDHWDPGPLNVPRIIEAVDVGGMTVSQADRVIAALKSENNKLKNTIAGYFNDSRTIEGWRFEAVEDSLEKTRIGTLGAVILGVQRTLAGVEEQLGGPLPDGVPTVQEIAHEVLSSVDEDYLTNLSETIGDVFGTPDEETE